MSILFYIIFTIWFIAISSKLRNNYVYRRNVKDIKCKKEKIDALCDFHMSLIKMKICTTNNSKDIYDKIYESRAKLKIEEIKNEIYHMNGTL